MDWHRLSGCTTLFGACGCECEWIDISLPSSHISSSHWKEIQFKIDTRNTKAIPIICSVYEIGFDNFMGNLSELKFIYIRFICSSSSLLVAMLYYVLRTINCSSKCCCIRSLLLLFLPFARSVSNVCCVGYAVRVVLLPYSHSVDFIFI